MPTPESIKIKLHLIDTHWTLSYITVTLQRALTTFDFLARRARICHIPDQGIKWVSWVVVCTDGGHRSSRRIEGTLAGFSLSWTVVCREVMARCTSDHTISVQWGFGRLLLDCEVLPEDLGWVDQAGQEIYAMGENSRA